jgi:dihydropteroate synthase
MNHVAVWQCRDRALDLATPVVMGVLNVTPDSFSDGGRFAHAMRRSRTRDA